jgi:hypothetical protein
MVVIHEISAGNDVLNIDENFAWNVYQGCGKELPRRSLVGRDLRCYSFLAEKF